MGYFSSIGRTITGLGREVGGAVGGLFSHGTGNDKQRAGLEGFAGQAANNYANSTGQLNNAIAGLQATANGQNSVSAEQLRQALQQNYAAQQSMAAGAAPQNAAMAARTAAIQSGRLGAGLVGQQAVAGLQERQNAQSALGQLILGGRGQDVQGTVGGYGAALDPNGDKSWLEKNGGAVAAGLTAGVKSDRRLKNDIADGDDDARRTLEGLKAYTYKYNDQKYGKGKQLGIMAQDLEKVVPDAVIDTPTGKEVHGAKLATALAATLPGLNKRLSKLEGESK